MLGLAWRSVASHFKYFLLSKSPACNVNIVFDSFAKVRHPSVSLGMQRGRILHALFHRESSKVRSRPSWATSLQDLRVLHKKLKGDLDPFFCKGKAKLRHLKHLWADCKNSKKIHCICCTCYDGGGGFEPPTNGHIHQHGRGNDGGGGPPPQIHSHCTVTTTFVEVSVSYRSVSRMTQTHSLYIFVLSPISLYHKHRNTSSTTTP